jgi:arabinan endo-1,5-alpha-L-arabinosidase
MQRNYYHRNEVITIILTDYRIRDPYIYNDNGTRLILYGSTPRGWNKDKRNTFVAVTSDDMKNWSDPKEIFVPDLDFWGIYDFWAPELHFWKDSYYLFASFMGRTGKRGTAVLRASDPLGPFEPWGAERITPHDMQCLDGTLYVENGNPYMVFCHEWVECRDGEMCVISMKNDLSGADGSSKLLFKASDAPWCKPLDPNRYNVKLSPAYVTDGPFLFSGYGNRLMMLWSSFSDNGYTIGLAWSEGGVYGPWHHEKKPVFDDDGGHCMLFNDLEGNLMLCLHQPNNSPEERAQFYKAHLVKNGLHIER